MSWYRAADLAQQAVRAHGLGPGLHHVGDDQRVVVGSRNGHHEVLEKRLFEVHQLHERNRVVYRKAISMIGLMANRMAMEMNALRETMPKSHRNVLPPRKPSSQPLPRAMTICPSASG